MRLTASEREAVSAAWNGSIRNGAEPTIVVVEAILTARLLPLTDLLARAEAGADAWGTCGGEWLRIADLRAAVTAALAAQPTTTEAS